MTDSSLIRQVAWAQESAQGGGPPTDWATDGVLFRFLRDSIDPSVFQEEMIPDERARLRVLGKFVDIHGIKGGIEFALESYHTGGEETSRTDADTQALTDYMALWEHALGRITRPPSSTASVGGAHGVGAVEFADASVYSEGDWLGFPDAGTGVIRPRRIDSIASNVCTLNMDLPAAPSDGDLIRGLAYADIDESDLIDSSVGPQTLAFLLMVGQIGSEIGYDARGCVASPTSIVLERNSPPKVSWQVLAASFLTPQEVTVPTFSASPAGQPGIHVGTTTEVLAANFGSSTTSNLHVPSFAITPGIVRTPVDTQTEVDSGMPGRSHYALGEEDCIIEMTVTPHVDQNLTDFENDQLKHLLYSRLASDGLGFAFYFPRAQITPRPGFSPVADAARGQSLRFKCLDDVDNAPAGAAAGWGSRMTVIFG